MKKKEMLKVLLMGLMAMSLTEIGFAQLGRDGDFQYWNTELLQGKISEKIGAYLEAEFRFGDDASEFYYQHTHFELPISINDWLEIGPAYRQVWEKWTKTDEKEDWYAEYRPMVDVIFKQEWNGWKFSDRNRFEYRMFEIDKDDLFRYRNKITIKSPWKWTAWKINPFISDEFFIQQNDGFNKNRFYVGIGLTFFEQLKGEIFYLWQITDQKDDWIDYHVLGTKLKLEF